MKLPKPECEMGFSEEQVTQILGPAESAFWHWMDGQTMCLCEARRYNHEKHCYEPTTCVKAHGTVVYPHDLERFLRGLPPLD